MTRGDRVAVMRDGQLQQIAPPMEVYLQPANTFVGGFIGSPAMNFFPCTLSNDTGKMRLEGPGFVLEIGGSQKLDSRVKGVLLGIRPQDTRLVDSTEADVTARVDVVEPLGNELLIHLALMGQTGEMSVTTVVPPEIEVAVDDRVGLLFRRDRLHLFKAESGERLN